MVDDRVGIIDRAQRFVLPPRFGHAVPFTAMVALVVEDREVRRRVRPGTLRDLLGRPMRLYHLKRGWLTGSHRFRQFGPPGTPLVWASVITRT